MPDELSDSPRAELRLRALLVVDEQAYPPTPGALSQYARSSAQKRPTARRRARRIDQNQHIRRPLRCA
jgi:hypothetical protein